MHSYSIFNTVLITLFGCTEKFSVEWKKKTLVQKREIQRIQLQLFKLRLFKIICMLRVSQLCQTMQAVFNLGKELMIIWINIAQNAQKCSKRFNNAQNYPTFFFFFRFKECKILTKINNGQQMFNLSLLYQFCLRSKP